MSSFRNSVGRRSLTALLSFGLISFYTGVATAQSSSPCDLNGDGSVTSSGTNSDVQLAVNMSLGLAPCTANIISPGVCNVVMVQRVVNAALGGACAVGVTVPPHSATLAWLASSTPNVTYKVLRGTVTGGPYTVLASNLSTMSYADTAVQAGATYYYVVRAVDASALESVNSTEAKAVIPTP